MAVLLFYSEFDFVIDMKIFFLQPNPDVFSITNVLIEASLLGSIILLIFHICNLIWDSPGIKL